MAFQDVAHGLVTDRVPEVGQGAHDPVVAPGAILLRHADDQRLQLLVNRGTPRGLALLGTVTFLRHELAVPSEDGIGFDDLRDFLQGFLSQLLADLRQGLALAITQPYTSLELIAENAIFGHQILIAQQQFLIDGSRDIRQKLFPIHCLSPQPWPSLLMLSMGDDRAEDKPKCGR